MTDSTVPTAAERDEFATQTLREIWLASHQAFAEDWATFLRRVDRGLHRHTPPEQEIPSSTAVAEVLYSVHPTLLREGITPALVREMATHLYGDDLPAHYEAVQDALLLAKPKAPRKLLKMFYG